MRFRRYSDFGEELRRPFEVHTSCYDCADFYSCCVGYLPGQDKATNSPNATGATGSPTSCRGRVGSFSDSYFYRFFIVP